MTDTPPDWFITIPIADLPEGTFEERRNWLCDRLRDYRWLRLTPYPDTLHGLINELRAATTPEEFDAASQDLFDLADSDGVWIEREGTVIPL